MNNTSFYKNTISLDCLISSNQVNSVIIDIVQHELLDALADRHPSATHATGSISLHNVLISPVNKGLILVPDNSIQVSELDDIKAYGSILLAVCSLHPGNKRLKRIANECISGSFLHFHQVALNIEKHISNTIYIPLIIIICALLAVLACFSH